MRTKLGLIGVIQIFAVALLVPASSPAQSEPTWMLGVGGSIASRYAYRTAHFSGYDADVFLGNTWMASLSLNRQLGNRLSLQAGLDYFDQEDPGSMITARVACWTAGVRASLGATKRARPYLEVLPALFGAKWSDGLRDYSITSVRPGVVGGIGVVGPLASRLNFDLGVRGHLSAGWPSLGAPTESR